MAKLAGADLCKEIFSDLDMLRATWVDSVMRAEGKSLTAGGVDVARLIGGEGVIGGLLVSMAPTCWLCLLRPLWLRKLPVLSGAGFDKYKNLLLTFQPGSR